MDKRYAKYGKNCIGLQPFGQKGCCQKSLWLEPPPPKQISTRKRAKFPEFPCKTNARCVDLP